MLAAAASASSRPWVLFASSREVYGEPRELPVSEDAPFLAINTYGRSKVRGEQLVMAARGEGIVRASSVRSRRRASSTRRRRGEAEARARARPARSRARLGSGRQHSTGQTA